MTQQEILNFFDANGGLRCKDWSLGQIKEHLKSYFGQEQRIYNKTCRELKRTAQMYQR